MVLNGVALDSPTTHTRFVRSSATLGLAKVISTLSSFNVMTRM